MLWFKHFADARRNPKLLRVERAMPDGYQRFFKLLEVVAAHGGKGANFRPELDLNGQATDVEWLTAELNIDLAQAEETLALFASVGLIDEGAWQSRIVAIPQMIEYRDEYVARRQKSNSSQKSQESDLEEEKEKHSQSQSQSKSETDTIPTLSRHNRDNGETVYDPDDRPVTLSGRVWRKLGIAQLSSVFQPFIDLVNATQPKAGETVIAYCSRVLDLCDAQHMAYPQRFLAAKRRFLEKQETRVKQI